jgi:hypothetical protein
MVWGHEEIKTERRARGFSPACSQSLGRHLDRAAAVRSFFAPIRPVVATSSGPSVKGRGRMESPHLGEGPRACGEAWERWLGTAAMGLELYSCDGEKLSGVHLDAPIYRPRSPAGAGEGCGHDHKRNQRSFQDSVWTLFG